MAPTQGKALYYPLIDIPDEGWLLSSLLLWDRIDRIVPEAVTPNDSAIVTEIGKARLLMSCPPDSNDQFKADTRLETWVLKGREEIGSLRSILQESPKALSNLLRETRKGERVAVHEAKMTGHAVDTLTAFLAEIEGKAKDSVPELTVKRSRDDDGEWLEMPAWAGNLYMCALAMSMSERRGMEPITDRSSYMGWARFLGDKPLSSDRLLLELKVPWPSSSELSELAYAPKSNGERGLDRIFKFREKYAAERKAMRIALLAVQDDVRGVDDPDALKECLEGHRTKVEKSGKDYKQALKKGIAKACLSGLSISVPSSLSTLGGHLDTEAFAGTAAATVVGFGWGIANAVDVFQERRKAARDKHPWHYAALIDKHLVD